MDDLEFATYRILEGLREDGATRKKVGGLEKALADIENRMNEIDGREALRIYGGYAELSSRNFPLKRVVEIMEQRKVDYRLEGKKIRITLEQAELLRGVKEENWEKGREISAKKARNMKERDEDQFEEIELKKIRKSLGLTPGEVARAIGIPVENLFDLEHNLVKPKPRLEKRVREYVETLKNRRLA